MKVGNKLCYQDGIWHKWILERCTEEEKQIYFRIKQRLEDEGINFGENKILRFLGAKNFNEEDGYERLVDNYKFYKENNVEILNEDEFQGKIDDQQIVHHKCDIYGRPISYMRIRYNRPDDYTERQTMQYMLWSMDKLKKRTPKHIDSYILIYDLKGAGWSNMSISQATGIISEVGAQFPETIYKIFVINSNWVVDIAYRTVKVLLYPKTLEKIKFIKNKELPDALLPFIPIENIPKEFGGEDEEYSQIYKT